VTEGFSGNAGVLSTLPGPSRCVSCGATALDLSRGWVRAAPYAPVYWACNECLDRTLHFEWEGHRLVGVRS
jgi:hypothetical protein